jgi:hypothetical protein
MASSLFSKVTTAPTAAQAYRADMLRVADALAVHYGAGFRNRLRATVGSPIWDADKSGMIPLISPVPVYVAVSQNRVGIDIHPKPLELRIGSNQTIYDLVVEGEAVRGCFSDFYRIGTEGFSHVMLIRSEREKADRALASMRGLAKCIRASAEEGSRGLRLLRGVSVAEVKTTVETHFMV